MVWDASSIVAGRIFLIVDCSSRGHLVEAWAPFLIHCWANYLGGRVLFVGAAWSCKRWSLLVALSLLTGPCVHKKNITLWSSQIVSTKNSRTSCSCVSCGCISEQEIVGWGTAITLRTNSRQIHAWVTHLSTRGEQFRDHLLWLYELGKFLLTTVNILIVVRGISIILSVIYSAILFNKKTINIQSICCFICDHSFPIFYGFVDN